MFMPDKRLTVMCAISDDSVPSKVTLLKLSRRGRVETLLADVYSAFNQRNINGALALMSESVSWPKASEGGT
jgi:hypothetical protein